MTKDKFVEYMRELGSIQQRLFAAEDTLEIQFATEGPIGRLSTLAGEIILENLIGDKELDDPLYERFWNSTFEDVGIEDLEDLYDSIIDSIDFIEQS